MTVHNNDIAILSSTSKTTAAVETVTEAPRAWPLWPHLAIALFVLCTVYASTFAAAVILNVYPRDNTFMDHSRALRASLAPLPRDWIRQSGRPRHTWIQTAELDLAPLNIGLSDNCLSLSTELTSMEHARSNGNVHRRTSHTMIMMMMTTTR